MYRYKMGNDFQLYKNNLRFFADADVESANEICHSEGTHEGAEDDNRLPEACEEGVIISHDQVLATEIVDNIECGQLERRAAHSVHEGAVCADLGRDDRNLRLELDIAAALVRIGRSSY